MFDVKKKGIISSGCICNGRCGRLLFERRWRDLTNKGGAVDSALDSKRWQYSGTRSLQKHSIMTLTAIRLHSDYTDHWYSLFQQYLKGYMHCLKGVYAFFARLSSCCRCAWHNTSHHRLCISSVSQWKSPMAELKPCNGNNYIFSILWHQLRVLFPLQRHS